MKVLDKIESGLPSVHPLYQINEFRNPAFKISANSLDSLMEVYQPVIRDENMVASWCVSHWKRNRGPVYLVEEDLYRKLHEEPCTPNPEHEKAHARLFTMLEYYTSLPDLSKEAYAPFLLQQVDKYYSVDTWKILESLYEDFDILESAYVEFPKSSRYRGALVVPHTGKSLKGEEIRQLYLGVSLESHPKRKDFIHYNGLHEYRNVVMEDHMSHSHSFHRTKEKIYNIVLIASENPLDFIVVTLSSSGIASNTQNLAVDEIRFLYNFFYCLTRTSTVVRSTSKKAMERVGRKGRRKVVKRSYRTISIDDETLSVIRKKTIKDSVSSGSEKCRHERSATKAKVWVLGDNLIAGEVIIASRTSSAGNKLFLVKRSRSGSVVNPHLEVRPEPNPIVKVKSF